MRAAVPEAAPDPEAAELAAEQRLASATEEAMLEDLQRAEAARYMAHQVLVSHRQCHAQHPSLPMRAVVAVRADH